MCLDCDTASYREWEKGFATGFDTVMDALNDALSVISETTGHGKAQRAFYNKVMERLEHPERFEEMR